MSESNLTQNITISKEEYDKLVECRTTLLSMRHNRGNNSFEALARIYDSWKTNNE
jgi:hypothetical protein